MANDYFQFKQFKIRQSNAAMKVSTDACIQGALFAHFLHKDHTHPPLRMLDIGTGTGVLSLMLAQVFTDSRIDAVEIDPGALEDARYNFENAKWKQNIDLIAADIRKWEPTVKYDAIICNPPFFYNQLPTSNSESRLYARHDLQLGKGTLIGIVQSLLATGGYFCVLYPYSEWHLWENEIDSSPLQLKQQIFVRPNARKPANRVIGIYGFEKEDKPGISSFTIYDAPRVYSREFTDYLKDYYLHL